LHFRDRVLSAVCAVGACLCALAGYGFRQGGVGGATGSWSGAAAYVGQIQTEVVQHEGLLYRQLAVPEVNLGDSLDRLEQTLTEGALWLEQAGQPAAAQAVRGYLETVGPARSSGDRSRAAESLAGPVHGAAGESLVALLAAQEAQAAREAAASAWLAHDRWQTPAVFGLLSLVLGLAALLAATGRRPEPAPVSGPEPVRAPARAAARAVRLSREAAAVGRLTAEAAGGLAAGLGAIVSASQAHAADLGEVARAAAQLQQAVARTAADQQQRWAAGGGRVRGHVEPLPGQAALAGARAGVAAEAAGEALRLARETAGAIDQSLSPLEALQARAGDATGMLAGLAERTHQIEQMVGAIKGIAVQTNMLALNAAIEAARAGERGKGFAVVADSVRQLAIRAQQHAREIEQWVAGVAGLAQESAAAVEEQRQLAAGASAAVQGARSSLERLSGSADASLTAIAAAREAAGALEAACRELGAALVQPAAAQPPAPDIPALRLQDEARQLAFSASETAIATGEAQREAEGLQEQAGQVRQLTAAAASAVE
jgi:methyl-accepting chemotaxis protein